MTVGVYLLDVGVQSALGEDVVTTLLAMRSGQSGFEEHPLWVDRQGEPIVLALSPNIDPLLPLEDRLLQLSKSAIFSTLDNQDPDKLRQSDYRLRLYLGLPREQPGFDAQVLEGYLNQLADSLTHCPWPIKEIVPLQAGRTAGLIALQQGVNFLKESKEPFCLAGAVDSWVNYQRLEWLEEMDLLHSVSQTRGFVPGEGAGFCLLSRVNSEDQQNNPSPSLLGISQAQEPFRPYTRDTPTGRALTRVCQSVLEAFPKGEKLEELYADFNGERWRATEYGFASLRLGPWLKRTDKFNEIACGLGDTGAATGPVMLGVALAAAQKGYAQGDHALVWVADDNGERMAVLIHTPKQLAWLRDVS